MPSLLESQGNFARALLDAGDPGAGELAHRAHRVQRLAEAGAGIGNQRHADRARHLAGDAHLLVHR